MLSTQSVIGTILVCVFDLLFESLFLQALLLVTSVFYKCRLEKEGM